MVLHYEPTSSIWTPQRPPVLQSFPDFDRSKNKKYPPKSLKLNGNRRISTRSIDFRGQIVSGDVWGWCYTVSQQVHFLSDGVLTWHHLVMLLHLEAPRTPLDHPKRLDTHCRAFTDVYWHRVHLGLVSNLPEMAENDPLT